MVGFIWSSKADVMTIDDIKIITGSTVRDSTLFKLQGIITSSLDFTNLNIDGSDMGKEGTALNADLINLGVKSTNGVITMKNWVISNSKFF